MKINTAEIHQYLRYHNRIKKSKNLIVTLPFCTGKTKGITVEYLAEINLCSKNRIFRIPQSKSLLQEEAGKLYIEGFSYSQISDKMGIAEKTISEWITKYSILDTLHINFPQLHNSKRTANFNRINFQKLVYDNDLRTADYILSHQEQLMKSLVDFIKINFDEINFEINTIAKLTGIPNNLLKDWLCKSRIINTLVIKDLDYDLLEKFEEKYVRANWKQYKEFIARQGIYPQKIYNDLGIDIGPQIRKDSMMLYKNFLKVAKFYNLNFSKNISFSITEKKMNSKKDHSLFLPRNKKIAEFVGYMLGDGHLSTELKLTLDSRYNLIIKYVDHLISDVLGEKISGKKIKDVNKWEFRTKKKSFLNGVTGLGIQKGNKKLNQIAVPTWIIKNPEYHIPCVRGLVDSDGSVFIGKNGLTANVSNTSKPILDFVESFCINHEFRYTRDRTRPKVSISRTEDVKEFLRMVKPLKLVELYLKKPKQLSSYFPNFTCLDLQSSLAYDKDLVGSV
jgi:hypothetical protein